jgi:hypothetical protein
MTVGDQFQKLKDNWLLIALFLVMMVFMMNMQLFGSSVSSYDSYNGGVGSMAKSYGSYQNSAGGYYPSMYDNRDFAPDEENRKIMKTVTMSTEVKRGSFDSEEDRFKAIVTSSRSFLLSENSNSYGEKRNAYQVGSYTVKVPVTELESVLTQLKAIGEIKSYVENKEDITGQYSNLEIELETEKARLVRYNQMFSEATLVADKITLNDRIFDQERTIKYMEEQIGNMDKTIDYSTIYFSIQEKRSEYANVVFVKFAQLIQMLVGSFNAMISLVFVLIPWAVAAAVIYFATMLIKGSKKK